MVFCCLGKVRHDVWCEILPCDVVSTTRAQEARVVLVEEVYLARRTRSSVKYGCSWGVDLECHAAQIRSVPRVLTDYSILSITGEAERKAEKKSTHNQADPRPQGLMRL